MSQGDKCDGGCEPRHGILNDNQNKPFSDQEHNRDTKNRVTNTNHGSTKADSEHFLPSIVLNNSDTNTPSAGSKKSRKRNEQKRGSSRSRSRSRVSETRGEDSSGTGVQFPDIPGSRSPSSKKKRRQKRDKSRLGEHSIGEAGEEDSEQDLSDYCDSDEEAVQAGRTDMNDKNQNVIRFVYSEAVRQALKNNYEFVHPLFTIPNSAVSQDEPKINFEILRLPEIYEDVNQVLNETTHASGHRRESRDRDGFSGTESHTSMSTRKSLKQDSKGNVYKSKLGDIGKRPSGKSISSDNSRSDKSNMKKKKNTPATKTVHFPSLRDGSVMGSGSKIAA